MTLRAMLDALDRELSGCAYPEDALDVLERFVEKLRSTEGDAEDAYVRGFAKGFDEGVSRAEREAWEALEPYIGPRGPLDTTDDACRLPADARETMTLAATVGVLTWRLARLAQACRLVVADARSDAATSNGPHLAAWAHDVATDLDAALREAEAMP